MGNSSKILPHLGRSLSLSLNDVHLAPRFIVALRMKNDVKRMICKVNYTQTLERAFTSTNDITIKRTKQVNYCELLVIQSKSVVNICFPLRRSIGDGGILCKQDAWASSSIRNYCLSVQSTARERVTYLIKEGVPLLCIFTYIFVILIIAQERCQ